MKISIRLALYSIIITTAGILLCSAILLITTANNHIGGAIDSGAAELRMLDNAFSAEMEVAYDEDMTGTVRNSLILYVFGKYASASVSGAHYILSDTQDILYNDCPIDPRPSLPDLKESSMRKDGTDIPSVIVEFEGRRYLAAGLWSETFAPGGKWAHALYLVRDITGVYDSIFALGIRFAVIAMITIVLSAAIMIVLIRRTLNPLNGLRRNAAALADGQYDNRIEVRGKDEISELAIRFNKMADAISGHIVALEDEAEQRKLLMSALTHELKTPMTAIIGYSESLMRVNLNPKQKEASIAYINKECKRLERLAQKMMRLITLQDSETERVSMPVSALYAEVLGTLGEVAGREDIRLDFEDRSKAVFCMDADMMASVLINLFDNARNAGAKHISVAAEEDRIRVIDDGEGIPESEIKNITQPFYMVDKSHSRSVGGSGLGLALCELIVRAHHARLVIESKAGAGTTVSIIFNNS